MERLLREGEYMDGRERGFTLIELLVSIAVFVVIIGGLTATLVQQQRQVDLTSDAAEMDDVGRAVLDYVASVVRNAASRQGKTFSLKFVNGGSQPGGTCASTDTSLDGSVDSPPDCLTVYTWDIARGQNVNPTTGEVELPSTVRTVEVVQSGPPLIIQAPDSWFPASSPPLVAAGDLIGFRSRVNLCSLRAGADCVLDPLGSSCTECGAILKITSVNAALKQIVFDGSAGSPIVEQNFSTTPFYNLSEFVNNFFVPSITMQVSEMSIVSAVTFSVDEQTGELQIDDDLDGTPTAYAGGGEAAQIVDLQFVFNLSDPDGGITKVGVPTDPSRRMYSSFSASTDVAGRESDIRSVEIYIVLRSRMKAVLTGGKRLEGVVVPQVGDRLERVAGQSLDEGYIYKVYNTTVYLRNMGREDFG